MAACPSQQNTPAVVCGLSTPSSKAALVEVGDWEEVGGEGLSSNEFLDFGGWSFPPSGKSLSATTSDATVAPPVDGTQPSLSAAFISSYTFALYVFLIFTLQCSLLR